MEHKVYDKREKEKEGERMKVYAVIERCEDQYYPDYMIADDCVYLKKEDAKKRLKELNKKSDWIDWEIYEFGVKE